ncbi:uncharacterized protein LOC131594945 isoform X2 [Vicia villosa]|uniref:uncharacterized protein LOC131594945 isoform X2 n=1 Tax=Vicia villosa TaxID=3911 RepID=UPI00273B8867|nr:uncharacterized protein LOC131594945 isoform X2 [Vicia villosa]
MLLASLNHQGIFNINSSLNESALGIFGISQNDVHVGEMTVKETLDFSARCQGVGTIYEWKWAKPEDVIEQAVDYKRPSQELVAIDLHSLEWRFRHIYRGMSLLVFHIIVHCQLTAHLQGQFFRFHHIC